MIVGRLNLLLNIPSARSLKDKRRVVKSLITRIKNKFNASVAEVGENDKWQVVKLGAAVVSNRSDHANSQLSSIISMIEREVDILVIDYDIEIN